MGAKPLLLVTTALPSFAQHPCPDTGAEVHPHLGRLLQPRHTCRIPATAEAGIPWACDNDAFVPPEVAAAEGIAGFNQDKQTRFLKMLDKIAEVPGCKFVTVPDVVGNMAQTMELFERWYERVADAGQPIGLVAQNGLDDVGVPWEAIDALFMGGDDAFKLSEEGAAWARRAEERGKWVHWGRVNSRKRMAHCIETGACDSLDGSSWAKFRKARPHADAEYLLDKGLRWLRELSEAPLPLVPRGALEMT